MKPVLLTMKWIICALQMLPLSFLCSFVHRHLKGFTLNCHCSPCCPLGPVQPRHQPFPLQSQPFNMASRVCYIYLYIKTISIVEWTLNSVLITILQSCLGFGLFSFCSGHNWWETKGGCYTCPIPDNQGGRGLTDTGADIYVSASLAATHDFWCGGHGNEPQVGSRIRERLRPCSPGFYPQLI